MPKLRYREIKENVEQESYNARRFYENKYFGLFLNAYKFTNLTKNQERYLLKKLWQNGTICAFVLAGTQEDPSLKQLLSNSSKSTMELGNDSPYG